MDPVRNPYAPGAGNPPPELAGRSEVIHDVDIALQRIAIGRSAQSPILVGLRGVGKTVLLVRLEDTARKHHYKCLRVEAVEYKRLPELIIPGLKGILRSLSLVENAKDKAARGLRVLRSFVSALKIRLGDIDAGITLAPEPGLGDSGDLETDLPVLFTAIGEAAKAAATPVALLVDELQYLSEKEFSALIMAIHRLNQEALPFILIGAGLPQVRALAGESKSYAERLFIYPEIGALSEDEASKAILDPAKAEGVEVEDGAIDEILRITQRYPYFLQQWAYDAWNEADNDVIRRQDVEAANATAISSLDQNFFRVRFDRCTPKEKQYMRALAELGAGDQRSGKVAARLGKKTASVGPVRDKLIRKGMIYAPQHGDTAFTVPLFDDFMRREMPDID